MIISGGRWEVKAQSLITMAFRSQRQFALKICLVSVQAEKQHFQLSLFRAIENRRPLLRSTNSGITALVLPSGDIVNPLEPFTKTYGIYTIPIGQKEGLTFYTRHPDLFGYSFLSLSLLSILYGISVKIYERVKRKKDREEYLLHLFERMLEE